MSSADPEERRERSAGHCLKRAEVQVCRRTDSALIVHLGPMARLAVMKRNRARRNPPEDLFQRLLARIPSASEKAELLKKLRSLHTG
jgi:hypothetical protein